MKILTRFIQAGVLFACLSLTGCGGEPYTYEPSNELKPGPGLFSGKEGQFYLIGGPKKEGAEQEKEKQAESKSPE